MKAIVRNVWSNKSNNQKLVTIPKNCEIEEGDAVIIRKVNLDG